MIQDLILIFLNHTDKINGLIPFDYLTALLEALQEEPDDIGHLLTWNIDLPCFCDLDQSD